MRIGCPVVFSEEMIAVFKLENISNLKKTKNTKFLYIKSFYAVFVKFMTDFVDWSVEKVNMERVVSYEEIIAVFKRKLSQIDTQKEEKPKIFNVFMQFLSNF